MIKNNLSDRFLTQYQFPITTTKNLLKVASAVALSGALMTAQAQKGDDKMMKKDAETDDKRMKDEKMKM